MRLTGAAMQMDLWYETILQELIEAHAKVTERLEPVEPAVEPDVAEDEESGA